ncbi:MAG: DUF4860 domain-containing protein [Lachnospiraceae bacterium]|nr:DUF4860 domain-containing protein [Lachnospiraceae bacterium]
MLKKRITISDIFPVILFLVFTLSVLCFVAFSAKLYKNIVHQSESSMDTDIAARYMIEKFRSHDELGSIKIADFKGHEAVRLENRVKDELYITYIYVYDGYLREIYAPESELDNYEEDSGTEILEIKDMSTEMISDNLVRFSFVSADDKVSEAVVSIKSEEKSGEKNK